MDTFFMPALHAYPEEAAIIGRLILGYGEIEYSLFNLMACFVKPAPVALRAVFRLKNESMRLETMDAYLRHHTRLIKLHKEYDEIYLLANYCRGVRNKYAHCHWSYDDKSLQFANLEEGAQKKEGFPKLKLRRVTPKDLKEQEGLFEYAACLIDFTCAEARLRLGGTKKNPLSRPPKIKIPQKQSQKPKPQP